MFLTSESAAPASVNSPPHLSTSCADVTRSLLGLSGIGSKVSGFICSLRLTPETGRMVRIYSIIVMNQSIKSPFGANIYHNL